MLMRRIEDALRELRQGPISDDPLDSSYNPGSVFDPAEFQFNPAQFEHHPAPLPNPNDPNNFDPANFEEPDPFWHDFGDAPDDRACRGCRDAGQECPYENRDDYSDDDDDPGDPDDDDYAYPPDDLVDKDDVPDDDDEEPYEDESDDDCPDDDQDDDQIIRSNNILESRPF